MASKEMKTVFMKRQQRWVLVLASSSLVMTGLLLPITINILTGYMSTLSPWLDDWIKGHVVWFLVATIILTLLALTISSITVHLETKKVNISSFYYKDNERGTTTNEVNATADIATQDSTLVKYSNRFSMLSRWREIAEDLIRAYNYHEVLRCKEAQHVNTQILASLEKLLKHTRRSFIYLNSEDSFAEIAKLTYPILLAQKRWKYAADLAYDIGRVYYDHELAKYNEIVFWDWIRGLRTCLKKANMAHNFGKYWVKVYNGMKPDSSNALDEPTDLKDKELFYEALTYAAKLYDLEGLSIQDDKEAKEHFEKALTRAEILPDKILSFRIKIHIAKLACRLHIQPVIYYTDILATLDALNFTSLDSFQQTDIINLKLTCYYRLGSLVLFEQSRSWYQRQIGLAKEYGALDFQVLAHTRLAEILLQEGRDQPTFRQLRSFRTALTHIDQARDINEIFSREGARTVEYDKLAQLESAIMTDIVEFSKEELL